MEIHSSTTIPILAFYTARNRSDNAKNNRVNGKDLSVVFVVGLIMARAVLHFANPCRRTSKASPRENEISQRWNWFRCPKGYKRLYTIGRRALPANRLYTYAYIYIYYTTPSIERSPAGHFTYNHPRRLLITIAPYVVFTYRSSRQS